MALAAPSVLVSIKPVHAITRVIMQGAGEPELLFDAALSPHHYALRPSHARALSNADLIIWIGPELESTLVRPIATLTHPDTSLVLLDQASVTVLKQRTLHQHTASDRTQKSVPVQRDPHIWLDPINAIAIAQVIANRLNMLDPAHTGLYETNLASLTQRLGAAHSTISSAMQPISNRSFAITHDSLQYFEKRYNLKKIIYLSQSPSVLPGAKRLSEVRSEMRIHHTECVFSEPQLGTSWVLALKEDITINSGTLDILGATLREDDGIETLLLNVAKEIVDCFSPKTGK